LDVRFGILGEIEVVADGRHVALPAGTVRSVLAALLLRPNRVVTVDELADSVWGAGQPLNARAAVQTCVMRLRKVLAAATGGRRVVQTRTGGYLIEVEPGQLDLDVFEDLCRRADEAAATGDVEAEERWLREALSLWRGPALSGVGAERRYRDEAARLTDKRMTVAERLCSRLLEAGRYEPAIEHLRTLTIEQPLRERLWYLLMVALYHANRRAEALQTYRTVSQLLSAELDVRPGEDLTRLHQAMLNQQEDDHVPTPLPPTGKRPWRVHRQLPVAAGGFVGQKRPIDVVAAAISGAGRLVPVVGVHGPPGVGKTALAVEVARRLSARFPDGQWYATLGATEARPRNVADVLAGLLHMAGVVDGELPHDVVARSALLRARLAGRRVLLLLDDAADVAQVSPLLPGTAGCAVIVTSRSALAGLAVRYGAVQLTLDVLSPADSIDLLAHMVGRHRLDSDPAAAHALVEVCGRLPLALRIAGANLLDQPALSLSRYVETLRRRDRVAA